MTALPATQPAIQLVGPDQIRLNPAKPMPALGPHDIRLRIDACGICFSDTKLSHAFTAHPRKAAVVRVATDAVAAAGGGFDPAASQAELLAELAAMSQYVPGDAPTVPGHEPTAHIVEIGSAVAHHQVGQRVLVQTDYRHLATPGSNAAFGYNFEGGLAQYAIVDERVVIEPTSGDHFLLPVDSAVSASAVALIEPWACVEAAYTWGERQQVKPGSRLLVVVEPGHTPDGLAGVLGSAQPASIDLIGQAGAELAPWPGVRQLDWADLSDDRRWDDIVYYGARAEALESLARHVGFAGLLAFALCGGQVDRPVQIDVGRVHYDLIRLAGTPGSAIAEAYARIPASSEVRPGERMAIIGAAGPMGLMHSLRTVVAGVADVQVAAVDVDDSRLAHLAATVAPAARDHGVPASFHNSAVEPLTPGYSYIAVLVPSPALLAQAVDLAGPGAIVNAFAGFAVGTTAALDLNALATRGVYLVGTSGSRIVDMKAVLAKVESGLLDTNVSLDAVCGLAGVADAIESVRNRTSGGKIMVYPAAVDLGLIRLTDLPDRLPEVAAAMVDGRWTSAAEAALLARARPESDRNED